MRALELFAGAGGLAMGISLAGFEHAAVIEWDSWACETIRENQGRGHPLVLDWHLHQGDVREFDYSSIQGPIDLLAGGPPCQPFSMGGKHRAFLDKRDMFPATIDAIRQLRPKAFLVENVKGLTRTSFRNYFEYIRLQLKYPDVEKGTEETVECHMARLERLETSGRLPDLSYEVVVRVVNAADYGVPQRRERVFLVGMRHDLGIEWSFPESTHSLDALLYQQHVTGEYWDRNKVAKRFRQELPFQMQRRAEKLKAEYGKSGKGPDSQPWRTTREAIASLPDPRRGQGRDQFLNHKFQSGARTYQGHTGSPLDLPAKTLKAGVHGVPGGENMMVLPNGGVRYFTVRESARLQTFPDGYVFHGSWSETMRQLGNAVPVALARTMSSSIAQTLIEAEMRQLAQLRPGDVLQ